MCFLFLSVVGYGYDIMPCYYPVIGYRSRKINESGKRSIVFNRNAGFTDMEIKVPCGKCIGCRIEKSRQWAIRCTHEAQMHDKNCFLTLTYSDENLPYGGTLVKKHLQDFYKRLRKALGPFRYFSCGEYGDDKSRPHYHAVIFGLDFVFDRVFHKYNKQGDPLYISETLTKIWGLGHCTVANANYSTAAYTARYVMKKITGEMSADHYQRVNLLDGAIVNVIPEFALMSLRPGLGSEWYDKYSSDVFPSDFLVHEGKTHTVPRYYTDKLKRGDEQQHKKIKVKRKKSMSDNPNTTPDRLHAMETVKLSQISQLKREL